MAKREEEIKAGALIVGAAILFLTALVMVGGFNLFRKPMATYSTFVKFAGGLEPGSVVRFSGVKVGTVQAAEIDPGDSTRIRVRFQVRKGTPVRENSQARISTLGFLGENYLEVSAGTRDAALLRPGSEVPSIEIVQLADVFNNVNNVTVNANKLVNDLDDRFLVLADNANRLLGNLNGVVSPENRQRLESALANIDALLAETRPKLNATLGNLEKTSAKLGPTLDNANATITQTKTAVGNLNSVVEENRKEIHEVLLQLRESLLKAQAMMENVNGLVEGNRGNLDEAIENVRVSSQNLKSFTDTIKRRPFSLVRIKAEKDREPPIGK